jgi:hypothetical protein
LLLTPLLRNAEHFTLQHTAVGGPTEVSRDLISRQIPRLFQEDGRPAALRDPPTVETTDRPCAGRLGKAAENKVQ